MRASVPLFLALLLSVGIVSAQNPAACTPGSGNVVIIGSTADYDAVKTCTSMKGLQILATSNLAGASLVFPNLVTLTDAISITNSALVSLQLPALTSITKTISISNCPNLATVIIGNAAVAQSLTAAQQFTLTNLTALTSATFGITAAQRVTITGVGSAGANTGSLAFPFLTTVSTQFSVTSSFTGTLSAPLMTSALGFTINNNNIQTLNFPSNMTLQRVSVTTNTGLTSVVFNPVTVGSSDADGDLLFSDNTGGQFSLDFGALTAIFGSLSVSNNNGLQSLVFRKAFGCRNVSIANNPLNTLSILSATTSGPVSITGNAPASNPGPATLGFALVGGNFFLDTNTFTAVTLPNLVGINGVFRISANTFASLSAPSTFLVNQTMSVVGNTFSAAGNLDLSGLQGVNSSLLIQTNEGATPSALNLTQLQVVAGQLLIANNDFINSINVPKASIIGALGGSSNYDANSNSTSFIVQYNSNLRSFYGAGSQWIVVGNLTISNNPLISLVNVNSLAQAGALSIQNDPALATFSASGLVCAAVIEFNSVPVLKTVTLTALSSLEQTVVIAQGVSGGSGESCTASVNSTSGACTGGTPACYNCLGTNGVSANCPAESTLPNFAPVCGGNKAFTCPTARALELINIGNLGTNTVDGAGTFGNKATSSSSSGASNTNNSNSGSNTNTNTNANSAATQFVAVVLVVVAAFAAL